MKTYLNILTIIIFLFCFSLNNSIPLAYAFDEFNMVSDEVIDEACYEDAVEDADWHNDMEEVCEAGEEAPEEEAGIEEETAEVYEESVAEENEESDNNTLASENDKEETSGQCDLDWVDEECDYLDSLDYICHCTDHDIGEVARLYFHRNGTNDDGYSNVSEYHFVDYRTFMQTEGHLKGKECIELTWEECLDKAYWKRHITVFELDRWYKELSSIRHNEDMEKAWEEVGL